MLARPTRALTGLLLGLAITAGCTAGAIPTKEGNASGAQAAGASSSSVDTSAGNGTSGASTTSTTTALAATHVDASDLEWDEATEVAVSLRDGGSTGGPGVTVAGDVVTITAAGTYRVSGSLSNGQLAVGTEADGVVRLVLDGVTIASSTGAALTVLEAGEVVVILAAGSENSLADAASYQFPSAEVDEPDAALFSTADLAIAGDGSLTVTGSYNDAIASKDGLVIAGGTITVTAKDDGIRGKDYLVVHGGTIAATAGGDALKSDNEEDATLGYVAIVGGTVTLAAGADGIEAITRATVDGGTLAIAAGDDAIHSEARVEVTGGTIDISRSYEGLEGTQIVISGGAITLVAEDDGLNVAGGVDGSGWTRESGFGGGPGGMGGGPMNETPIEGYYVEMSGGTLVIDAGGDGFDSNGSATVTGGTIVVSGPLGNGNGAIDVNGEFLISDAVLLAAGSIGMVETPSASSAQATLLLQFISMVEAGNVVRIQSSDGADIATFEASKAFQSLVFSSPEVAAGASYDVLLGGSVDGESLGGLYLEPAYTGGTVIGTVSATTR